jgi:hypothetical protein
LIYPNFGGKDWEKGTRGKKRKKKGIVLGIIIRDQSPPGMYRVYIAPVLSFTLPIIVSNCILVSLGPSIALLVARRASVLVPNKQWRRESNSKLRTYSKSGMLKDFPPGINNGSWPNAANNRLQIGFPAAELVLHSRLCCSQRAMSHDRLMCSAPRSLCKRGHFNGVFRWLILALGEDVVL